MKNAGIERIKRSMAFALMFEFNKIRGTKAEDFGGIENKKKALVAVYNQIKEIKKLNDN